MARLVLIPTPIGNLGDITLRAIETLKQADLVMAEDTRTSGFLLKHLGINKKIQSFHKFNEHKVLASLVQTISTNQLSALMSDAGTPGISDPGYLLVNACIEAGIDVECLPGPTALIPALVVSGLPCDRFCFEGFLPVKKGRKTAIEWLKNETRTIVFYESPHRLAKTLEELSLAFEPERKAAVSRELSKKFEEIKRGCLQDLAFYFKSKPPKGEIVLVVAGKDGKKEKKLMKKA